MQTFVLKARPSRTSGTMPSGRVHAHQRTPEVRHILRAPQLQTKLKIGAVDDPAEREADRVADQVMRMPARDFAVALTPPPAQTSCAAIAESAVAPCVQRQCPECEHEMQRKEGDGAGREGGSATPATEARVAALGSGTPLPTSERTFFEPRFGQSLAHVRVHSGGEAGETARAINARAFTLGRDITFAAGEFRPGAPDGRRLIAHELTHTLQQQEHGRSIQLAPLDIVGPDFTGPLQQNQRRAAAAVDIKCGDVSLGTLYAMAHFMHQSRGAANPAPPVLPDGIGAALHFIRNSTNPPAGNACANCTDFKMIQVLETNAPATAARGNSYVDNAAGATPFYDDVYRTGSGQHEIPVGYVDAGEKVKTTRSIYDRPFRAAANLGSLNGKDFSWNAEACATCVKAGKDKVLGCITYGFTRAWNATTNSHELAQPVGPGTLSSPSAHFVQTLTNDTSTSSYQFET